MAACPPALSKRVAKRTMGVRNICESADHSEEWLLRTVERLARDAGIGMPEVGIFASSETNAFATGMNRNNALVAVSSGLRSGMKDDEVEAVLGHER